MYRHADPTTFSYSELSAKKFYSTPPATVPQALSSQSPYCFYSLDNSDSGSIPSPTSLPEIPSHKTAGYNYPHRSNDQLPRFSITGDPYGARIPPLETPLDPSFAPPSYFGIGDPRNRPNQFFPRIRTIEVVFTDDAKRKLGEGVHRWCFNCRATETTTWRRSSLSPGKLLCNRCGLFERTHHIPRPEKFPRKRRARPASLITTPAFSGEQREFQYHLSSTMPPTQFFQPFDAVVGGQSTIGEQSTPQRASWMTQNEPEAGPSISPGTGGQYYSTSELQAMCRGDGQMM
jgi:hypothetical protein